MWRESHGIGVFRVLRLALIRISASADQQVVFGVWLTPRPNIRKSRTDRFDRGLVGDFSRIMGINPLSRRQLFCTECGIGFSFLFPAPLGGRGGIWFGLVGWVGYGRRKRLRYVIVAFSIFLLADFGLFPLFKKSAGVMVPIVDCLVFFNPSIAQCIVKWAGITGPFRASRNFCGGERGQIARRRKVQGPPPEIVQVADCLCFMDAELAGKSNQFRMPAKRLMTFDPSHDVQPDKQP